MNPRASLHEKNELPQEGATGKTAGAVKEIAVRPYLFPLEDDHPARKRKCRNKSAHQPINTAAWRTACQKIVIENVRPNI